MNTSALLQQPHVSVLAPTLDPELARVHDVVRSKVVVSGREELEVALCELLAASRATTVAAKTLDLIGHSASDAPLVLGSWVIDGERGATRAFFRELADLQVLPRLGVQSLRLLGCASGVGQRARQTIARLSDILGLEVAGTRDSITPSHYDAGGFREDCDHLLVKAGAMPPAATVQTPFRRVLDVEMLPAVGLGDPPPWPRYQLDRARAGEVVRLIARGEGAEMPEFRGAPSWELALPAVVAGRYYRFEVLLDGAFVRVYPDGDHLPGVVFPVRDSDGLRALST